MVYVFYDALQLRTSRASNQAWGCNILRKNARSSGLLHIPRNSATSANNSHNLRINSVCFDSASTMSTKPTQLPNQFLNASKSAFTHLSESVTNLKKITIMLEISSSDKG
eukprot:TRINITY_DN7680_c0_g1_i1.p1 TRINITY_DN7680_c0_g1~~TRINITY_DN7680_c0_g1_i1.p1  ORF type:complete len:110 (-),score=17.08 TRINITY_DN7680_c0_g1_i1:314-643(-)